MTPPAASYQVWCHCSNPGTTNATNLLTSRPCLGVPGAWASNFGCFMTRPMLRPACQRRSHSHGPPGYGHPGHGHGCFGTPPSPAYGPPWHPGYPGHPPAHLPCHGHARNLVQSLAQINLWRWSWMTLP